MTPEQYKAYIVDMLDEIHSGRRLKQIYTIVHRAFINEKVERLHERKDQDIIQYG